MNLRHRPATAALLALGLGLTLLLAGSAAASNDIAKKENLPCATCHDKPGSKLLTDQGKYYELMGGLEGYAEVEKTFGRCTYCHARKPGSKKLTREGKRLAGVMTDMQGLRDYVLAQHPKPAAPAATPPPMPSH